MKTEKTQNNILTWFILCLVFAAIGAFLAIYFTQPKEIKPTYTVSDSIKIDSLEKQIANRENAIEYHRVNAEKFKTEKDNLSKSNYKLSEKLKELLKNPAAKCEDKLQVSLFLNDSLKLELNKCDSAYFEVDKEAQLYSDMALLYKTKDSLNINRNKQLSFQMDSLIVSHYKDSIQQAKTFNKAIQKEKGKTLFYKVTTTVAAALGIYGVFSK